MKLLIKNMLTTRCKLFVKMQFEALGIPLKVIELGEVETVTNLSTEMRTRLKHHLNGFGFELIEDRRSAIIERIKILVIQMIRYHKGALKINFSSLLIEKLNYDYNYLSNVFSADKGITIEGYIIAQKIERVKELLIYNELTLKEIAWQLHYSSVAHLSNQFKKVTGITPTYFKQMKDRRLIPIESF